MTCNEMHESHDFKFSTSPQNIGSSGLNAQNNAMSSINVSELSQTLPHLEIAKIRFYCGSGYFTQFLAKNFS